MRLGAGEVATLVPRYQLERMCHGETDGSAFANGDLERLVGKDTGGG